MDENKVIFSGEFDPGGIRAGAQATVVELQKVKSAQIDLKDSVKELNKELNENAKRIEASNNALKYGLDKKFLEQEGKMNELLKKKQDDLNTTRKATLQIIDSNNTAIKNLNKTLNDTGKTHDHAANAIEKFTNVNELAAEGITHFKRKAVEFGTGLLTGFVGVIVGAALPSVEKMVEKLIEAAKAEEELSAKQKLLNGIYDEAAKSSAKQVVELTVIKGKLNDLSISQEKRTEIAKDYNKIADEANRIDLTQINNLDLINEKITAQIVLIKQRALARAAESALEKQAEPLIAAQFEVAQLEKFKDARKLTSQELKDANLVDQAEQNKNAAINQKNNSDALVQRSTYFKTIATQNADALEGQKRYNKARVKMEEEQAKFDKLANAVGFLITPEGISSFDKGTKEIENVYRQKLLELRERLSKINAAVFQSESTIKKSFFDKLLKEEAGIDQLLKEKKLTGPQSDILKSLLGEINQAELDKGLEEFKKKVVEARIKINDAIAAQDIENAQQRLNNLRDEFERQNAAIDVAYDKSIEIVRKKTDQLLKQIDDNVKKGLVKPGEAKKQKSILEFLFAEFADEAAVNRANAKLDLALRIFEKTLTDARETFNSQQLGLSEGVTKDIDALTKKYLEHGISFENYQKKLTKILRDESLERKKLLRDELIAEFTMIQQEVDKTTDAGNKKKLKDKQAGLAGQIDDLNRAIDSGEAGDKNADDTARIQKIAKYAQAIGNLTTEVIGFWQKVNEVEQAQLQRSVDRQEKRVQAAQRIAARGNAEYLRLEEDRLVQLQIKQENAAKKQLAINAVLTASQALVAFVSAIAQGAAIGGPLGAIASGAAVIGLLATGYAIVKSLQDNQPKLFKGTKSLGRKNGEPAGRDTIPALLNEGEAVIPTDTNKAYHKAIAAIYDKTIPPDVINNFVTTYPKNKIPKLNYDAINDSAQMKVGADGRLINIMEENNAELRQNRELLKSVDTRLKKFGLNINMDKHGFALSFMEAADQLKKSKKA